MRRLIFCTMIALMLIMLLACGGGSGGGDAPGDNTEDNRDDNPGNEQDTPAEKINMQGAWYGELNTDAYGMERSVFFLTQSDDKINGSYIWVEEGFLWRTDDISGAIDNGTITIRVKFPDGDMEYAFKGQLDDDNGYSGNIAVYEDDEMVDDNGTFTHYEGKEEKVPDPLSGDIDKCGKSYLMCRLQCEPHLEATCTSGCYSDYQDCRRQ